MPHPKYAISPEDAPAPALRPGSVAPGRSGRAWPVGWVLALASLVALVSLYFWVVLTTPEILGLDSRIHDLATRGVLPGNGCALAGLSAGTNTGPLAVGSLAVTMGIGLAFSMRRAAAFAAMTGLSALTVTILKDVVARSRPDVGASVVGSFAWPSGHSAGALTFAVAVTVALYRLGRIPGLVGALGLIPAALLVGYSRIVLSVHWFSDVAAGWAVSFFAVGMVLALQAGPGTNERYRPAIAYGTIAAAVSVMVTAGLR